MLQYSCFTGTTGYAIAARNNIKALLSADIDFVIDPLDFGFDPKIVGSLYEILKPKIKKVKNPKKVLMHCIPTMQHRNRIKSPVIGYATFEADPAPESWIDILSKNEHIIVPSMFNLNLFDCDRLKDKLVYIPHCLDFKEFNPYVKPKLKLNKKTFNFLYMGTWKERKNLESLLSAFILNLDLECSLTLKLSQIKSGSVEAEIKRLYRKLTGEKEFKKLNIFINTKFLPDEEIPGFMKSFDCVINPSMGEGFGLVGIQSMALGVPTILSDKSGQADYTNNNTSFILDTEPVLKSPDGYLQFKNTNWNQASNTEIGLKMREVISNKKKRDSVIEAGYNHVVTHFGFDQFLEKIYPILY